MKRRFSILAVTLFLAVPFIQIMRAQESAVPAPDTTMHARPGMIGGHEFIVSSFIPETFVRTYLQTSMGFGTTLNRVAEEVAIHDTTYEGKKGELLYALLDVEYQYAIRSWLAVRGRLSVTGRMANATSTLIARGVTLFSGFEISWLFEMAKSDRLSVSGLVGVKNNSTTDVYLQRFIEGVVDNGKILPGNSLVLTTPILRGTAGIQGAYVLSRLTGMTIAGTADYGESMYRDQPDRWYYSLLIAFDFNLHSQDGTPVGFVLGGKTGTSPEVQGADSRTAHTIFGRIAYTGAEQFALGLDLGYQFIPIRNQPERQGFLSSIVDMRLYF